MSSNDNFSTGKREKRSLKNEFAPCEKEMAISYKCVAINGRSDKCSLEFENYKLCKAFWVRIIKERKRKGIVPTIPRNQVEMDEILANYRSPK